MRIALVSYKGGVGKTTSALHIADWFGRHKGKTLLVDGDPNRSALSWGRAAGAACTVSSEAEAAMLPDRFEHLIFDTKARPEPSDLEAFAQADVLVIPTTPEALAIEATLKTIDRLRALGAEDRAVVLITMVPPYPRTTGKDAREALTGGGIQVLKTLIPRAAAYDKAALNRSLVRDAPDRRSGALAGLYDRVAKEVHDVGK